jgi:hypothetical protein
MADIKINMWSGPRNISTAIMYSFAQRSDTKVIDEPFYAHYLLQSGAEHPGRAEVLESQPKDPSVVLKKMRATGTNADVLFIKNMAHHMIEMGQTLQQLFEEFIPVFLIREPADMLLSLDKTLPDPTLRDTGYQQLLDLFETAENDDIPLIVLDSKELLEDPEFVLSALCEQVEIHFQQSMLSWQPGPIPEDGIWAKYWYDSVHSSTGFKLYTPKSETLPNRLDPLYDKCKSIYDRLFAHAIKR